MDNIMSRLDTIDAVHCNLTEAIARIDVIDDRLARIEFRLGILPIKYTDENDDMNEEATAGCHTIPSCHSRDYKPTANWDESINPDVQSLLDCNRYDTSTSSNSPSSYDLSHHQRPKHL